jgi:serine/threonine protein kinase
MLHKNEIIKLTDFSHAATIRDRNVNGMLNDQIENLRSYRAPEMNLEADYFGDEVDVFALGVMLFVMLKGSSPFYSAEPSDHLYLKIALREYGYFWSHHSFSMFATLRNQNPSSTFSNEFKNLFQ